VKKHPDAKGGLWRWWAVVALCGQVAVLLALLFPHSNPYRASLAPEGTTMKKPVFLCWSGDRSKQAAETFSRWLPYIIQTLDPFISTHHIGPGGRWGQILHEQLKNQEFGMVFLTRDNLSAPWIHFEAGALSKTEGSRVCIYL
jgi:hypothetical protein